jgi:atlastin
MIPRLALLCSATPVLLMDTQGMFDNESTMTLTAQIFGISTLVSSFQIYNVQNQIGEDKLQHLALFSEYGRIALRAPTESDSPAADAPAPAAAAGKHGGGNGTSASASTSGENVDTGKAAAMAAIRTGRTGDGSGSTQARKPFQHLQFLVRDWANFDTEWAPPAPSAPAVAALRLEMQSELKKVIAYRSKSDLQSTRDQIERCFERVDAWLLPHPGSKVTNPRYDGQLEALDPLFRLLVDRLARHVFDQTLEPKRVQSRHISAPELLAFFDAYVKIFQEDGSMPQAMTMLDATSNANNRNAYDLSIGRYKNVMTRGLDRQGAGAGGHVTGEQFQALHDASCVEAWELFKEVATMGSIKAIEAVSVRLNDDIAAECSRFRQLNDLRNP